MMEESEKRIRRDRKQKALKITKQKKCGYALPVFDIVDSFFCGFKKNKKNKDFRFCSTSFSLPSLFVLFSFVC